MMQNAECRMLKAAGSALASPVLCGDSNQRLKLLFDEHKLKFESCRKPLWGLRIGTCRTVAGPGATVALWCCEGP